MAKFGQGLIQGLTNPQFQQGLFELGDRIAERRRDERELQSIQGAAALGNKGVQFAQAGNTQELQNTINQLTDQLGQAKNVNTAAQIQSQINKLQGLIPDTKQISTRNSINTVMGIDGRLANKEAMKTTIRTQNPTFTEQQVEAQFNTQVSTLTKQRNELLSSDTLINEGYQGRRLDLSKARAAQEEIQAREWLAANRSKILAAIKSGKEDNMAASINEAPAAITEQAQDYLAQEVSNHNERRELEDRSIAVKKAPEIKSFKDQISTIEDYDTSALTDLNQTYEEFVEKHWDGKKWTGVGEKNRAAVLEKNLRNQIYDTKTRISDAEFDANASRKAGDERIIRDARISIDSFRPTEKQSRDLAETLAAEKNEEFDKLAPEDQADYIDDARSDLTEENRRANLAIIASVDPSQAPARTITEEENVRFTGYSEEDQEEIMEEYAYQKGQMSLTQVMQELEEDEFITAPEKKKEPSPPPPTRTIKPKSGRVSSQEQSEFIRGIMGDFPTRGSSRAGRPE
tara:strand:- start:753 stop:2300 length:1548 start_codon:yes stop_codon:yes gene_type:complete